MVLTIRPVHLTNTTSTGIAFVPTAKSYLLPNESLQIVVSAIGDGGIEYYGTVEAIYELLFYGENPPNVIVFKCYWFQPKETRRTHEHIGLV